MKRRKSFKHNKRKYDYPSEVDFDGVYSGSEKTTTNSNVLNYEIDKFQDAAQSSFNDVKNIIISVEQAIKLAIKKNPNLTLKTLQNSVFNLITKNLLELNTPSKNDLFYFKTIEKLINNPDIITTIISSYDMSDFINNNDASKIYNSDFNSNYIKLLNKEINKIKGELPDDLNYRLSSNILTSTDINNLSTRITKSLKQFYDANFNAVIKKGYINKLVNCAKILDFSGFLNTNNNINTFRLSSYGLDFLSFDYFENSSTIDKPYISQLMDTEFAEKFSIDELIALCAFYTNRLAKDVKSYNDYLYILYKTDLLKKYIENPDYCFDLSDEEISSLIIQHKILQKPSKDYIDYKLKEKRGNKSLSDIFMYEDINNPIIKNTIRKYDNNYENEFSSILPNYSHDFFSDFERSIVFEISTSFVYNIKHNSVQSLLLMLLEDGKDINWGIILDRQNKTKYDFDKNNNLLIGFDMKEFNMPIKLHCSKEEIIEFLQNYNGNAILPVYRGNFDSIINGKYLSTQILCKLSKEQIQELNEYSNTLSPKSNTYRFVQHLLWMSCPEKIPDHIPHVQQQFDLNDEPNKNERDNEER